MQELKIVVIIMVKPLFYKSLLKELISNNGMRVSEEAWQDVTRYVNQSVKSAVNEMKSKLPTITRGPNKGKLKRVTLYREDFGQKSKKRISVLRTKTMNTREIIEYMKTKPGTEITFLNVEKDEVFIFEYIYDEEDYIVDVHADYLYSPDKFLRKFNVKTAWKIE
jgi:hypothetical protein